MFQCHAVMSYLCGMQDTNLALRETLKTFINNSEHTHELKFRCLTSRRAYYDSVSIGFDAETFEKVILKNCVASTSLRRFFRVRNYNHKQNFIYILLINKQKLSRSHLLVTMKSSEFFIMQIVCFCIFNQIFGKLLGLNLK